MFRPNIRGKSSALHQKGTSPFFFFYIMKNSKIFAFSPLIMRLVILILIPCYDIVSEGQFPEI